MPLNSGRRSRTAGALPKNDPVTQSDAGLWVARIFGIGLHLPMLLIFIVQGLIVPTEGVLFLVALWLALLVAMIVFWVKRSYLVALVPFADVIVVNAVTWLGSAVFDWGAGAP